MLLLFTSLFFIFFHFVLFFCYLQKEVRNIRFKNLLLVLLTSALLAALDAASARRVLAANLNVSAWCRTSANLLLSFS